VGLTFYPKDIGLAPDHCLHTHIEKLPERFAKQKLLKDWIIEGPFQDFSDDTFCFFLINKSSGSREQFSISESDMLFKPAAVDGLISKLICRCMEVELGTSVAKRLMGSSQEEIEKPEGETICVVEDFSRGKGRVYHHRRSLGEGDALPEKKNGGLILPSR
jgi:hypothetical protein